MTEKISDYQLLTPADSLNTSIALACEIGLDGSVALLRIERECKERGQWRQCNAHCDETQTHFHQWKDFTGRDLSRLFPFWTVDKARRICNQLALDGWILEGAFSSVKNSPTAWYALNYYKLATLESIAVKFPPAAETNEAQPSLFEQPKVKEPAGRYSATGNGVLNSSSNLAGFYEENRIAELVKAMVDCCKLSYSDRQRPMPQWEKDRIETLCRNISLEEKDIPTADLCEAVRAFFWFYISGVWWKGKNKPDQFIQGISAPKPEKVWDWWKRYRTYCENRLGGTLPEQGQVLPAM